MPFDPLCAAQWVSCVWVNCSSWSWQPSGNKICFSTCSLDRFNLSNMPPSCIILVSCPALLSTTWLSQIATMSCNPYKERLASCALLNSGSWVQAITIAGSAGSLTWSPTSVSSSLGQESPGCGDLASFAGLAIWVRVGALVFLIRTENRDAFHPNKKGWGSILTKAMASLCSCPSYSSGI